MDTAYSSHLHLQLHEELHHRLVQLLVQGRGLGQWSLVTLGLPGFSRPASKGHTSLCPVPESGYPETQTGNGSVLYMQEINEIGDILDLL